jgi:hypothetical protein
VKQLVVARRQLDDQPAMGVRNGIGGNDQSGRALAAEPHHRRLDLGWLADRRRDHSTANFCAAAAAESNSRREVTLSGLIRTATCPTPGAISLSTSRSFAPTLVSKTVKPVRLPPGCARLCTSPSATGSALPMNMMGTVLAHFVR